MAAYKTIIPAFTKSKPAPFTISISEDKLQQLTQLLKVSPVGPDTYENRQDDRKFGITREWLSAAKTQWEHEFDW